MSRKQGVTPVLVISIISVLIINSDIKVNGQRTQYDIEREESLRNRQRAPVSFKLIVKFKLNMQFYIIRFK